MEIRPAVSIAHPTSAGIEREQPAPAAAPAAPVSTREPAHADAGRARGEDGDLRQAVERINESLPPSSQGIEFSVDTDTDRVIVKVVDRETREVLRQMPSKEALEIAKALDRTQGLLIKSEA